MAETTNFVIQYLADISRVKKQIKDLESINRKASNNFSQDFSKAVKIIDTRIASIRNKPVFDKKLGKDVIKTFAEIETVFKGTDGKLKTLKDSTILTNGRLRTLSTTVRDGASGFRSFGANLATLAKRAILTIPVWLALRGAILGVPRAIADSFRGLIDFDRALQKARRNLQGSSTDIERNFQRLASFAKEFAIESGQSAVDIVNAFQKFATVGFDFETSLSGATNATKLAVVLFGDAEESANAFARSMRVLIDRSENAVEPSEQIAKAIAQTAELWKENAFEVGEFTQSLEKFAGTAKTANISTQETIALLATLSTGGLRAGRGGTLLRTSIQKLVENLDKLAGTLGVSVNPQLDSTFDVLLRVLGAIEQLTKTSKIAPEATEAIAEIFGGVRGAEPIRLSIALNSELRKNLQILGDVAKLDEAYEEVTNTLSKQSDIYKTLRTEIGKTFVNAVIGADNFVESLIKINKFLEGVKNNAQGFGRVLNQTFRGGALLPATFGLAILDAKKATEEFKSELLDLAQSGLKGDLGIKDLTNVISNLTFLANEGKIDVGPQLLGQLRNQLSQQVDDDTSKNPAKVSPNIEVSDENIVISFKKQQEISKLLLEDELNRLRILGASTAQLLKAEGALTKQFDIKEDSLDVLKRELELEKSINEERRLRNTLSSDTVKLFRIAQDQGTNVAKQIGDVLAGNVDFNNFVRQGGEALDIFKEQFGNVFEQQQAQAFFKGDITPGLSGLRGGSGIAIEEQAIRKTVSPFDAGASLRKARAETQFQRIQANIQTTSTVNVNVEGLDFTQARDQILAKVSNDLKNPQSDLGKAIDSRLENF